MPISYIFALPRLLWRTTNIDELLIEEKADGNVQ